MSGILEGVRIVDLTRYIAGPFCTMLLADMGAEVIKIEKPGEGDITRTAGPWKDGVSIFYTAQNRNKKSISADMRTPEGMALVKELIAKSDMVVENYRAGTMEKMGLSYEELKKINPEIILVSISGFGQSGPMRDRLAFDGIISAVSGVTRIEGDHVERSKGALHDHMAAMYATIASLMAIMEKKQTGKGQFVDVAMIACSTMIRNDAIIDCFLNGEEAAMAADDSAPYGYLRATNGWINFHGGTNPMFHRLLELIDDPFLHEERFYNDMGLRVQYSKELFAIVQEWAKDKTCEELEEIFTSKGIPSGIVATPSRLLNNKQLRALGYITEVDVHGIEGKVPMMGFPVHLSNHADMTFSAPPDIGEHNDDIYRGVLGKTDEELAALKEKGVI